MTVYVLFVPVVIDTYMLLPFVEQFISFTFDRGQASKRESNKHFLGNVFTKKI